MKSINLLVRFLLELAALAAVGYSGYHAPGPEWERVALAIVAPVVFAVLWSFFAAHKARFKLPRFWKALLGAVLLEVTAVVLALQGQGLGAGLAAVVIAVNSGMVNCQKYQ